MDATCYFWFNCLFPVVAPRCAVWCIQKANIAFFPEQTYFFPSILFFALQRKATHRSAAVDSADSFLSGLIVVARVFLVLLLEVAEEDHVSRASSAAAAAAPAKSVALSFLSVAELCPIGIRPMPYISHCAR